MLVADLRRHGVQCWFAPDSLKIGDSFRTETTRAIKAHDKVLLVMSKHSMASQYVEAEVETAFAEERRRGHNVLFPIRLDFAVSIDEDGWSGDIQRMRNVGDLTGWNEPSKYEESLERILRDLVKA